MAVCVFADEEQIPILRHDFQQQETGEYNVEVEQGDGTAFSQRGHLIEGEDGPVVVMTGSFRYIGDDGRTYTVSYTADEAGFHPQGDHFPVA